MLPGMELMACPNLAVPREVMHHVVRVESSYNPYAIGVVGGRLVRQPRNLPEALSTVRMLEQRGYNFSLGVAQVNRYNLAKYGLETYEQAFQPCANLQAGSRILAECYRRSGSNWGKSFSCYYSGDFVTGFRHGYVQKIYASMRRGSDVLNAGSAPIAVIDRVSRRAGKVPESTAARSSDSLTGGRSSLAERRVGNVAVAPQPQVAVQPVAGDLSSNYASAAGFASGVPGSATAAASSPSQLAGAPNFVAPSSNGPVVLSAVRLGEQPASGASNPVRGGDDNAFVF